MGKEIHVTLVIPSYKDSKRLGMFLPALAHEIMLHKIPVTIIVVDDGSGEPEVTLTKNVINSVSEKNDKPIIFIPAQQNLGKGGAIRLGWDSANEETTHLAFVDADGAVNAQEVARLLKEASHSTEKNFFATRIKMLGKNIERKLLRHISGRIFATLVSILTDVPVYDSQCGFKIIPMKSYQRIRPVLRENRFAFDVELMLALLKADQCICEIPVDWKDIEGSKVSLLKDSFKMALSCLKIRKRSKTWTFKKDF